MKKFSSLLHNLILTPSRNTKIKLLQDYFKTTLGLMKDSSRLLQDFFKDHLKDNFNTTNL